MLIISAGISSAPNCGVIDYARRLSTALEALNFEVETIWAGPESGASPTRWLTDILRETCASKGPAALILHYSVFAYAWRGVPLWVPQLARRLRRLGVPVVLFAHEFIYPWRNNQGWRGAVKAATQRLVLIPLATAANEVIVTTEERMSWLCTRWWLPKRRVAFVPVFANIVPLARTNVVPMSQKVGLFGFGTEGLPVDVVCKAVSDVRRTFLNAQLTLIGAPGPTSPVADRWRDAAMTWGCPLTFTGIAEPEDVSREIAACELMLFPDPAGPTSRRTSLATLLCHGQPVVALDGPERWADLCDARAVSLVNPTRSALVTGISRLMSDDTERAMLGERARLFYRDHLGPDLVAQALLPMLTAGQLQV